MRTKILLSVVIVLVIGVAAAGYQINSSTPGLWQPITPQTPTSDPITDTGSGDSGSQGGSSSSAGSSYSSSSSGQAQTGTGGSSVQISTTDAKSIAQKVIEQPGATVGTPTLEKNLQGQKVYLVPVIVNNKKVGFIEVDPKTGEVTGGAGDVSQ